jgi:hypothetical protein
MAPGPLSNLNGIDTQDHPRSRLASTPALFIESTIFFKAA